jgi:hypothetical protein
MRFLSGGVKLGLITLFAKEHPDAATPATAEADTAGALRH